MKTLLMKFMLLVLMLISGLAIAQNQEIRNLRISNPSQTIGLTIGDVLTRTVTFEGTSFQKIDGNNLPIKGTREKGIELVNVKVDTKKIDDAWHYKVDLSYQIFANANIPTVMQLPPERIAFSSSETVSLPEWRFWFSPLVVSSIENAPANLQPQVKTPKISISMHQNNLIGLGVIFLICLLGLFYFNIDSQWLPFIGGPFSKSYRAIKKLAKDKKTDKRKLALLELHEAFNHVHGGNLFAQDVEKFLVNNPKFQKLHSEISAFFALSNNALFTRQSLNSANVVNKIAVLSKQLRDCERGM